MFFVWLWRRECKSHSFTLYSGKGLMGNYFCPCGGSVGVPRVGEGGIIQLEGPLCGEKEEKNLEFYPVVYFLDGMEGKE